MQNKVKSITEKIPQVTTLPDGFYYGTWGGYVIEITSKGKQYELATEGGVRGIGIKVVVEIKDGVATFDTVQSDGTQQELCISDVIGRLLKKAEILYGKTDDIEYKIEQYDDGVWVVQHKYIPYERDDVVKICRVNDL